ncbi:hypothetical protein [Streptomyces xanthophaeus]|uniref:hypothetical protein n=1 Tax=Streptomyces xanthophaeus TaxID=67385 RepID=UPI003F59D716|nr:hypothetical protein KO717_16570 [Streptomyces xanthophaeus]
MNPLAAFLREHSACVLPRLAPFEALGALPDSMSFEDLDGVLVERDDPLAAVGLGRRLDDFPAVLHELRRDCELARGRVVVGSADAACLAAAQTSEREQVEQRQHHAPSGGRR